MLDHYCIWYDWPQPVLEPQSQFFTSFLRWIPVNYFSRVANCDVIQKKIKSDNTHFHRLESIGLELQDLLFLGSDHTCLTGIVSIDGECFKEVPLDCGVPQGSIMGPLIVAMYILLLGKISVLQTFKLRFSCDVYVMSMHEMCMWRTCDMHMMQRHNVLFRVFVHSN